MSGPSGKRLRGDPEKIGRFRIIGRIGSGSMGVVYAADDEVMGRQVALKVLIADLESDPDTRARFSREALAAARVIHPNVITVFDAGHDGERSFIAMPLLQGAPLAEYLKTPDAEGLERKVDLMIQVCEGLSAAHAHEVVHRDLKPSNLFVQSDGLLKILDFGIARLAGSNMTVVGTMLGTPDYMSPEQARGAQVSASSDIFSAGAVFYFMLTGRKPFKGPELTAVLRQLALEDPELPAVIPPELAAIVLGAMAKDPAARPPRIDDVQGALVRFRRHYGAETRRLAESALALRAEVRDLVNEVDAANTALAGVPVTEAVQAVQALEALESRFPPPASGDAAMDLRPFERRVVESVLSDLAFHRDALAGVRDAKLAQSARLEQCLERASAAIDRHAFEIAVASLDEADTLQPGWPETARLRQRVADERTVAEFEVEFLRIIAEEIRYARAAFRRGRADEAVQQLRTFMEVDPRAEALGAELARLEQLRETLTSGAAAARRVAADHLRRAAQFDEMGLLDAAIDAARQALAADPIDASAAALLDELLVRAFETRVAREAERLAEQRMDCARPAVEAARRAMDAGYVEFASRAAAAASRVAPASEEARALADDAAAQLAGEDLEMVDLGPAPYETSGTDAPIPAPANRVATEPPRLERAIGMLKSVFSKSAPASPRRHGARR